MARSAQGLIERHGRKPLFVRVLTRPALRDCWSVNVSVTGIGLVANPRSAQEGPREGSSLELEFPLPEGNTRIRVQGTVRWRHDDPGLPGATASLGVIFQRFQGSDQVALARYVAGHQTSVVVAFASVGAQTELVEEIQGEVQLLFADSMPGLDELARRGDVAAIVLAGDDGTPALEWLDRRTAARAAQPGPQPQPEALAPSVVLAAPVDPSRVVELFNRRAVVRSVPGTWDAGEVRAAILQACRDHGVQIEQRRMAVELEKTLLRQRPPPEIRAEPAAEGPGFGSPAMKKVMELVCLAAPHKLAVLLQGETGTGKEVIARAIHRLSSRAEAPFIVQDCGAMTETLLESELFGHAKGAFTGAINDHPGLFVLANGGTIFLDEIENTTPNFQAKLLRVLETGEVRPVGGSQMRQVDVRLVAAANRDLEQEVLAGRFRSDLYYRLNAFTVTLPPLRDRFEDILPLAYHFVSQANAALQRSASGLAEPAQRVLLGYRWPGNVRELRNVIERAVLLSRSGGPVGIEQLPEGLVVQSSPRPRGELSSLRDRVESYERELIRESLERHRGVLRQAAADLKMNPVTLGRRARRHGLYDG